jgi:hypothetical protein
MLAKRGRAVLPMALVAGALAFAPPALAGAGAMSANDDHINAAPTGVVDALANDTSSSTEFTIVANTQPANGTASCSALGACFYRANAGFTGDDTFTYTARNADGTEDVANVVVSVGAASNAGALIARDDDLATRAETAKGIDVIANDTGDGIRVVDWGDPKHGTATCDDRVCTYTPNAGYVGTDGFVYTIQESGGSVDKRRAVASGREATAAVHILVAPANTGYRLTVGGAPLNPQNGSIPPGGKAAWALGIIAVPEGISGQELAAIDRPEGRASLSGPHALSGGSLKTAKGWTADVGGDGRINYRAGDGALLGDAFTQTFPKPLPPISQGTGGDGHVPILVGSKVFAFYHHSQPTSATCVDRATGEGCPGYPKTLQNGGSAGFNSTDNNGPGVVEGSKVWVHLWVQASQSASIGLFCWDAATDSTCGYTIVDRVAGGSANGSAPVRGGDGKMWFTAETGKAYCVDPASGDACGSVTTPLPATTSSYDAVGHGSHVYFSREQGGQVTCVDTTARAVCGGWTDAQTFGGAWNLVNRHAASGEANGICVFFGQSGSCMSDDDPSADGRTAVNNFVHFEPHYSGSLEAEFGTRTLVGSLDHQGVGCYDWSVPADGNPGSPCTGGDYGQGGTPGWISTQSDGSQFPPRGAYGVVSDGSCAIALGDGNGSGRVYTVDPAGTAPCVSLGSGTDRTTIDLRDQRCDGTVGAASWRNVVLSDTDDEELESVVVTVRDAATGQVLASGEVINGEHTLDLSGVSAAQHPSISIDATAKSRSGDDAWSDGIPPRIRVNWRSDPQQACLQTQGDSACGPSPATVTVSGALANGSGGERQLGLLRNACPATGGVKGETAKKCGGKRLFRIHLKYKGKDARKVTVTVRGKKQKQLDMRPRPVFRIDLRKYARQRIVVKITIITKAGKKLTGTRVYHPCTKKRPGRGFRF